MFVWDSTTRKLKRGVEYSKDLARLDQEKGPTDKFLDASTRDNGKETCSLRWTPNRMQSREKLGCVANNYYSKSSLDCNDFNLIEIVERKLKLVKYGRYRDRRIPQLTTSIPPGWELRLVLILFSPPRVSHKFMLLAHNISFSNFRRTTQLSQR